MCTQLNFLEISAQVKIVGLMIGSLKKTLIIISIKARSILLHQEYLKAFGRMKIRLSMSHVVWHQMECLPVVVVKAISSRERSICILMLRLLQIESTRMADMRQAFQSMAKLTRGQIKIVFLKIVVDLIILKAVEFVLLVNKVHKPAEVEEPVLTPTRTRTSFRQSMVAMARDNDAIRPQTSMICLIKVLVVMWSRKISVLKKTMIGKTLILFNSLMSIKSLTCVRVLSIAV